jgi:hypothetical protein
MSKLLGQEDMSGIMEKFQNKFGVDPTLKF